MGLYWMQSSVSAILFSFLMISPFPLTHAQYIQYPSSANLSSSWTNSIGKVISTNSSEPAVSQPILLRQSNSSGFICGFHCFIASDACFFGVLIFQNIDVAELVWSANRKNPFRINASSTLELTEGGDLTLEDADGNLIWSTNTSGKSVAGLNLTEEGNLVLFDINNATVWQSFDYPTDCLLLGQKLVSGKELRASVSASNWSEGMSSLLVTDKGMVAYVESSPPQFYYNNTIRGKKNNTEPSYIQFRSGRLALYVLTADPNNPDSVISIPEALTSPFLKLDPDGHLRVYEWKDPEWKEVADLLNADEGNCEYPLSCGRYGICSEDQCSCPSSNETRYFRAVDDRLPNLGCSEITPISCSSSQYYSLMELDNFRYSTFGEDRMSTDMENCKQACLKNCSCKGARFLYANSSYGDCYLLSEVFSLIRNYGNYEQQYLNSTVLLKVVDSPIENKTEQTGSRAGKKRGQVPIIIGSSLGSFFVVLILTITCLFLLRKQNSTMEVEEDYLDQASGMPTRFSYEDLNAATDNFSRKLGEGGFGSVYEGTLSDGVKVAVKQLEGLSQVKKSFLAEVETIGSIHHVNLVRLIGFCAEKSHRLLVYEYMCNGSLDKWIFQKNQDLALGWQCRKTIILDIAKGLSYLHEECRKKILHLDIKPQNILLDEHFNAKVADFGLSKLIDRDQSQVVTTMRGTPGYLAPEWLSAVITEKVDVYSFGVVVLEILCGRKNIDRSRPEEDMHLLSIFKRKAQEEQLLDMVDKYSTEEMQLQGKEVVRMMRVAAWCLQSDFAKRPSMSMVVKAMEGLIDVDENLDYSFSSLPIPAALPVIGTMEGFASPSSTPLLASILSGPR